MDKVHYEYRYAHLLLDLGEVGKLDTPEQTEKLADLFDDLGVQMTNYLMTWEGGGFEAVSHNLTVIGDKLVVTLLTRRPALWQKALEEKAESASE